MYGINTPHTSLHNSINTCAFAQTSTGYRIAWDQFPSHTEKADDVKILFSSFAYALCWSWTQTPLSNSTLACIHPWALPSQSLGFPSFATALSPSPEGSSRGEKEYAQMQEWAENKKRLKKTLPKDAKKIIKSMRKLRLTCTSFNGFQILEVKISYRHSAFRAVAARLWSSPVMITSTRINFAKQETLNHQTGNTTHEPCGPKRNQTKEHQKDTHLFL